MRLTGRREAYHPFKGAATMLLAPVAATRAARACRVPAGGETLAPTVSHLSGSDDRRDAEELEVLRCTTRDEPACRSRLPGRPPSEVVWHRANRPSCTSRTPRSVRSRIPLQRSTATNRHPEYAPKGLKPRVALVCFSNWPSPSLTHHEQKSSVAYSPAGDFFVQRLEAAQRASVALLGCHRPARWRRCWCVRHWLEQR
jgi:hypothetical protein